MPRRLIFGGTFNPVHIGHLRAAIEAVEALGFDVVEWIPAYSPRHKEGAGLLPFDLRVELLRAAVRGHERFRVNDIEKSLPVPSFTVQTVESIGRASPDDELSFMLGDREFLRLPKWVRGRDVAALCNLAILCRTEFDPGAFEEDMMRSWPSFRRLAPLADGLPAFELVPGRHAVLLTLPRIEVSASLVRRRWLEGRNLAGLLPAEVIDLLKAHREDVAAAWAVQSPIEKRG